LQATTKQHDGNECRKKKAQDRLLELKNSELPLAKKEIQKFPIFDDSSVLLFSKTFRISTMQRMHRSPRTPRMPHANPKP